MKVNNDSNKINAGVGVNEYNALLTSSEGLFDKRDSFFDKIKRTIVNKKEEKLKKKFSYDFLPNSGR